MPFDISRLLNESPELADRALEAGSDAVDFVSERWDNASRTLRQHPGLLVAGGLLVGFAAAGVYLGARHWRARELERLRAEHRALLLEFEREEQLREVDEDFPPVEEPLMADGRSLAEIDEVGRFPDSVDEIEAADPDNPLSGGPDSQEGSVVEAEFADRNTRLDGSPANSAAEELVDELTSGSRRS